MTTNPPPAARLSARPALALLLLTLSGAGHAIVPSTWEYSEDTDGLTDQKTVSASGWHTSGVITVQCRDAGGANELSAQVWSHRLLGAGGEEREVAWRFDRLPVAEASGQVSMSNRRTIVVTGQSGERFVRELAAANLLTFRTQNHRGVNLTSRFDALSGASRHVHKVLDACR